MRSASFWGDNALLLGIAISLLGMGFPQKPPVVVTQAACNLAWDRVDNPYVTRYEVTVRTDSQPDRTSPVLEGKTVVSCEKAGANHNGNWVATVKACTEKWCGKSSAPLAFTITTP